MFPNYFHHCWRQPLCLVLVPCMAIFVAPLWFCIIFLSWCWVALRPFAIFIPIARYSRGLGATLGKCQLSNTKTTQRRETASHIECKCSIRIDQNATQHIGFASHFPPICVPGFSSWAFRCFRVRWNSSLEYSIDAPWMQQTKQTKYQTTSNLEIQYLNNLHGWRFQLLAFKRAWMLHSPIWGSF